MTTVTIEVSPGELIDRITILEIKAERIADPAKRADVVRALGALTARRDAVVPDDAEIARLTAELKEINATLWEVEDDIRACEAAGEFGARFVALARSVYLTNDRRAAVKRAIDDALGSELREVKSYRAC